MDGILKVFAGVIVALVVLRVMAQLLVGLTDVSELGCPPARSLSAAVASLIFGR